MKIIPYAQPRATRICAYAQSIATTVHVLYSRDFTNNLALLGGAFTRALKFEKLKAPLFPGPRGAVDTNDWCITLHFGLVKRVTYFTIVQFNWKKI